MAKQLLAMGGAGLPALLELDDMPADLPVGLHLDGIDSAQHLLSRLADQGA